MHLSLFPLCRVRPHELLQVQRARQLLPPEAPASGRQQHHTGQHAGRGGQLPARGLGNHVR